ncbi:Crp/Fnr family transcriptional regulator [Lachnospiraceae bacterium ZAX-1]
MQLFRRCNEIVTDKQSVVQKWGKFMEQYIQDILLNSKLFQNFDMQMLNSLMPKLNARIQRYAKQEIIFQEKSKINVVGVIITGELCAAVMEFDGQENLIQKLRSGYTIGAEISCTSTQISPYALYCVTEAQIFLFPYKVIAEHGWIAEMERSLLLQNLLEFMAFLNRKQYRRNYVLSTKSARERIMRYLIEQSRLQGKTQFMIPYNREQLANYLCLNRSVLSHELSLLQQEGILKFNKNKFWFIK